MKILVFAHSSASGGAENALRNMVNLLRLQHDVSVVLPSFQGSEPLHYRSLGISCYELPYQGFLPNFSAAALHYALSDLKPVVETFRTLGFDFVISNTISILHGALIARALSIPHLFYAHEVLSKEDLWPTSISAESYLSVVEETSDLIFSCSEYVSHQFKQKKTRDLLVIPPFNYEAPMVPRGSYNNDECVIQVVGTQSIRKNIGFAVTMCKSLLLRGLNVRLDIIGSENNGTQKLLRTLHKRNVPHRIITHQIDPYDLNRAAKVITLVCATVEPYGLTVPESLRSGIPILANRSGGTQEILPDSNLYSSNNLDAAVRKIEGMFHDYDNEVKRAYEIYEKLRLRQPTDQVQLALDDALIRLVKVKQGNSMHMLSHLIETLQRALLFPLDLGDIASNIAAVTRNARDSYDASAVLQLIEVEQQHPGRAVLQDIKTYDVVPFAMSPQMDVLYKRGIGLATELAATHGDSGRLQMAAFIVTSLVTKQKTHQKSLRVLALGDGIGTDTIRLAQAGFSVDYMDYDQSNMSNIAKLNFDLVKEKSSCPVEIQVVDKAHGKYDAIVCLEVIEHVNSPIEFASGIADYLADDGLLFMSECFNGIENRWPTHLEVNESYAGMLPWVICNEFDQVDCNLAPYGKPYVFTKHQKSGTRQLHLDRAAKIAFINNQIDVGV